MEAANLTDGEKNSTTNKYKYNVPNNFKNIYCGAQFIFILLHLALWIIEPSFLNKWGRWNFSFLLSRETITNGVTSRRIVRPPILSYFDLLKTVGGVGTRCLTLCGLKATIVALECVFHFNLEMLRLQRVKERGSATGWSRR